MKKHAKVNGQIIVGLTETVSLISKNGEIKQVMAKIDTGATRSSIDIKLATKLQLGPVIKSKIVKSASGNKLRPVIEGGVVLAGKKIESEFTLADRTHMKYAVLIGVNVLKKNFDAILIACRRYHRKISKETVLENKIIKILADSKLEVKNKIVVVFHIIELQKEIKKKSELFHIIEGSNTITVITSYEYLSVVKKLFKNK